MFPLGQFLFVNTEGERLSDKLGDIIKQFGGTDDKTKKKLASDILDLDVKFKKLIAAANMYFKNTQLQSRPPGIWYYNAFLNFWGGF